MQTSFPRQNLERRVIQSPYYLLPVVKYNYNHLRRDEVNYVFSNFPMANHVLNVNLLFIYIIVAIHWYCKRTCTPGTRQTGITIRAV